MSDSNKGFSHLVRFQNAQNSRDILFSCQCVAYKLLIAQNLQNEKFPIPWSNHDPVGTNQFYNRLIELFDARTASVVQDMVKAREDLVSAVLLLIRSSATSTKKVRRARKQSTRVYSALMKNYNDGKYGPPNADLKKAIQQFHYSYRASFLTLRARLNPRQFRNLTSANIMITLDNGQVHAAHGLYAFDDRNNCYRFRGDLVITRKDMRMIHLHTIQSTYKK